MENQFIQENGFIIKKNNVGQIIKEENNKYQFQFLPDSFVSLLVGKPGSGKSHLLRELLKNPKLYKKHFSYVFIFSPNEIKDLNCQKDVNYFNQFDIDKILKIIEQYNKSYNLLFIFDDFVNEIKKKQFDPRLQSIFYNRRHKLFKGEISFIITTQKYLQFPAVLRTCITQLYLFEINKKEIYSIANDVGCIESKQLIKLLKYASQIPYQHLLIILQNYKLYINFDEIILD